MAVRFRAVPDDRSAAVDVRGLRKTYPGGVEAVRGIDFLFLDEPTVGSTLTISTAPPRARPAHPSPTPRPVPPAWRPGRPGPPPDLAQRAHPARNPRPAGTPLLLALVIAPALAKIIPAAGGGRVDYSTFLTVVASRVFARSAVT